MIAISISRFVLHLCWHVMDVQEQIPRNLISIGISGIGLNSLKLLDAKRVIKLVHKAFSMRTQNISECNVLVTGM